MSRISTLIVSLTLVVASACGGGGDGPTNPGGNTATTDGNMSATINGAAWRSMKAGDLVSRSGTTYIVAGGNLQYAVAIAVANLTGPGTFSLIFPASSGSNAVVTNTSGGSWGTASVGGSGTVTVTTLTANRIAGTFSFDGPSRGGSTGTMQVRNGTFDLTF